MPPSGRLDGDGSDTLLPPITRLSPGSATAWVMSLAESGSSKPPALGFGVEPVEDFRIGEPGEEQHERHHHPERAAPPIHRRKQPTDDRPAQMRRGEGTLRNRDDPGAQSRVEEAGDQCRAAAGNQPPAQPWAARAAISAPMSGATAQAVMLTANRPAPRV